jgi:hypothetical protein
LYRNDVVSASPIDTNVKVIGFNLAHSLDLSPQMTLQRIASDTSEEVNQPVVSDNSE